MNTNILYLFTRTPLHVGAGSSVGAIDQPVQRERHTGFPIIPGSSLKGVFRDYATHNEEIDTLEIDELFGVESKKEVKASAGRLSFGEARLLAFPLRSAKGSFALATCPLALARYARDCKLSIKIPEVEDQHCLAGSNNILNDRVVLEEYVFTSKGEVPNEWISELTSLMDDTVVNSSGKRIVILSDGDFSHFAINACQVSQHVRIDPITGTAVERALFNAEMVPSETMFYSTVTTTRGDKENSFTKNLSVERLLQFGGDATTGLGFCSTKLRNNNI